MGLAEIRGLGDKLRIDSKYFSKAAVAARHFIEAKPNECLEDITTTMRKGIFDIKSDTYTEQGEGIPFVRISDLKDGMIRESSTAWISEEAHKLEFKTALKQRDIVLSKTAYPAAALVTLLECNVSQDTIAVKLSETGLTEFDPEFIVAFLNSSLGMAMMEAEFQGNVQEHLALSDARRLTIPKLSGAFQAEIRKLFEGAISQRATATNLQSQAEAELYAGLGLAGWTPPLPLTYTARAGSVAKAGRIDAEYHAPRIRELIDLLGRSGLTIGDIAPSRREKFDPSLSGSFSYIEIGNLPGDGTAESIVLDRSEAPSRATWHVHTGDVITSTVRPIRRLSALIEAHQDGDVCSSGFVVLQPAGVRSEVLLTYLRLPIFCELMDLHTSASMYPAISENDLLGLPFAQPDPATEASVCTAVTNARRSHSRASALLDVAKRAVEIAIEEDETTALRFLDEQEA
ncbi:hypothetical protein [Pararhodobacter marinus]|uniref:hypothetical protein n=1 Tax=Pararhodobacter marinus TaxID=2184063 RepID=UPI0035185A9F